MGALEKANLFLWAWVQSAKSAKNLKLFTPFLLYGVLQGAVLTALVYFAYPPFSAILVPLLRRFFGPAALHYPQSMIILPDMFHRIDLILSGIIGVGVIGVATQMFATRFNGEKPQLKRGIRRVLPLYGILFLIWVLETALVLGFVVGLPHLLAGIIPLESRFLRVLSTLLGIIVGAAFAYTSVLVVWEGKGIGKALKGSFSLFGQNTFSSFFLVAIPTGLHLPFDWVLGKGNFLVSKFTPEIIGWLLILYIGFSILTNYFLIGPITGFYLLVKEES